MINDRLTPAHAPQASRSGWVRFWFSATQPDGLHWLRVFSCLLFIGWLLPLAGRQTELFSLQGWFDTQAYQDMLDLPGGAPWARVGRSLIYAAIMSRC